MPTLTVRQARERRHKRVRRRILGTAERPRLVVFRSNRGIEAQLVDDLEGKTVASASWLELRKAFKDTQWEKIRRPKTTQAAEVGKLLARNAKEAGIKTVVFDRGGYLYHGRVKALADGAREGGLNF
jgi:large subunit ribosomal protein L18